MLSHLFQRKLSISRLELNGMLSCIYVNQKTILFASLYKDWRVPRNIYVQTLRYKHVFSLHFTIISSQDIIKMLKMCACLHNDRSLQVRKGTLLDWKKNILYETFFNTNILKFLYIVVSNNNIQQNCLMHH